MPARPRLVQVRPDFLVKKQSRLGFFASACVTLEDGCPMQKLCASGEAAKPDPAVAVIAERLEGVKHKVLVLSGKGGVGKSSFSAQLAMGLAGMDQQVGLLDIDICGPSQPKMMGVEGEQVHQSSLGWSPVYPLDNLGVRLLLPPFTRRHVGSLVTLSRS
eukprot:2685404-Rhodomonas_salina.1